MYNLGSVGFVYNHETFTTIKIMNIFITCQSFLPSLTPIFILSAGPRKPLTYFTSLHMFAFSRTLYKLSHIICTLFFFVWTLSLSIIILRFTQIVVLINSSFLLLLNSLPLYGYTKFFYLLIY